MYETLGVELSNTDIEVIRGTSLGIEGWALCYFGNSDIKADVDSPAPLGSDGPAPLVAVGHRAGDTKVLIEFPSAPLSSSGLAPLVVVGHRAGDESPPMEAAAANRCNKDSTKPMTMQFLHFLKYPLLQHI